jgi:hypothetical protein
MRSNKRFSSNPFTKRVDYDGGAHRGPKAAAEPRLCTECGGVYHRRRWIRRDDPRAALIAANAIEVVCPACAMIQDGRASGWLRLEGAFLAAHQADLERLIENEAERAGEDNPLGRIAEWDRSEPGVLTVATTTEHLTERIGRAVHSAYGGTIHYGFSHGNKMARAVWHRD